MSLFAELKRRNVFRVAAAYLVTGWLLVEGTSVLIEIYAAPDWIPKMLVGLLLLGFPVALFFAWAFEITPEGIKRESEVDRTQSITGETGRRLDLITIIILLAVVALVAADRFLLGPGSPRLADVAAPDRSSIAVLPFRNMSADSENVYFSDGVAEEILNVLARVPDLQVAARTSSFRFRGDELDIPAIAAELGVATVLEGSVRKQGERVRITAQLIDAANGFHLWSDTYDRELDDIFAIQDEIAAAIARALSVQLDVNQATDARTNDPEAYDLYLQGMHRWRMRTGEDILAAIRLFEQSRARDPKFARAYEGLAQSYVVLATYTEAERTETNRLAEINALHALALDPSAAGAYATLGNSVYEAEALPTGLALLERAVALDPKDANARGWLGLQRFFTGDVDGAIREHQIAIELDPQFSLQYSNLGYVYFSEGRLDDVRQTLEELVEVNPNDIWIPSMKIQIGYLADEPETIVEGVREAAALKGAEAATRFASRIAEALRGGHDAAAVAAEIVAAGPDGWQVPDGQNFLWSVDALVLLLALEQPRQALQFFEAMAAVDFSNDKYWGIYGETFSPLRCFARFQESMRKLGYGRFVNTWECE